MTEVLRFGLVGVAATLVHASVYLFCLTYVTPQMANVVGFFCALAISYFGHRYFSFARTAGGAPVLRFLAVAFLGFSMNAGFVHLMDHGMDAPRLAFWCITFVTPALTYVLLKFWVFASDKS